ncbi:hypothetical protein [Amycolatopsis orientalis]|uniref:hypothetical protein n=1 Tax=Amycolatopsis orientalis TaxID=31958 RepID=UPI0003A1A383|nr:hypothetical protein [Amycolatopsis orientalis]
MTDERPREPQTANPRRTQVDDDEERPPRRPEPESPLEDEEGRSKRGHPQLGDNFRGES